MNRSGRFSPYKLPKHPYVAWESEKHFMPELNWQMVGMHQLVAPNQVKICQVEVIATAYLRGAG